MKDLLPSSDSLPQPNDNVFDSDFDMWEEDLFPSSPSLDDLINMEFMSTPAKVVDEESTLLRTLRIDTPLTPVSIRTTQKDFEKERSHGISESLAKSLVPLSPESPSSDPYRIMNNYASKLFNETLSPETSLRLPLPTLPPLSPRPNTFPSSMRGLYLARDGFACDAIASSEIDRINSAMDWRPLVRKVYVFEGWEEDVEGDWEAYVDYTGSSIFDDDVMTVLLRSARLDDAELRAAEEVEVKMEGSGFEFREVLKIVRKRKDYGDYEGDGSDRKRSRWSQKYRIGEFMSLHGRQMVETNDEQSPRIITCIFSLRLV